MEIPGGLAEGEQPLRWLVPSSFDFVPALRRARFWFLMVVVGGVLASLCVGFPLTILFAPLGLLVIVGGFVASFVAGIGVLYVVGSRRPRWWVTTRRLIVHVGSETHDLPIADITDVDASAAGDQLTVTVGGEAHTVRGVSALSELWGAILFARAWAPETLDIGEIAVDENVFRWGEHKDGMTVVRGLLVLRPTTVAWIPERIVRSGGRLAADIGALAVGARIHRIEAVPPLGQLAWLLMRLSGDAVDREAARAATAWGGWCTVPSNITWNIDGDGDVVTLEVAHEGITFAAHQMPRAFVDGLVAGWNGAI